MNPLPLFHALGIRSRVFLIIVIPMAFIALLLAYFLASARLDDTERGLAERGALVARNLALASEFPLFSQNIATLGDAIERVAADPAVRWAAIWDKNTGKIIFRGNTLSDLSLTDIVASLQSKEPLPELYYAYPIRVQKLDVTDYPGEYEQRETDSPQLTLGYAIVQMDKQPLLDKRDGILWHATLITLSGLLASGLLAIFLGRYITRPILALASTVRELRGGDLKARLPNNYGGELGQLVDGVNAMADGLQTTQEQLRQQVSQATQALEHTVEELEKRNIEIEQARLQAMQTGRERMAFLARMSHEIRTPLNVVIGFTKLLQSEGSSARSEQVTTIQRAAEQLLTIVNDILHFIRLEEGAEELESYEFNIGELLEDTVGMLAPMANEKDLELVLLLHSDMPHTMVGDPVRLAQVIANLVNNAIKFTVAGEVVVEASRQQTDSGLDQMEITVRDTGIGINVREQEHIFTEFAQGDSSITRRFGGTGLGLPIARGLVELMGGEIGVESDEGSGAKFWIRLPCIQCSGPAEAGNASLINGRKVLVYDSNPFARRSLRNMLFGMGCQVVNVPDVNAVLERAADANADGFDAIVLGLNPSERQPVWVEAYLNALGSRFQGPILLLIGCDEWSPPEGWRSSSRLSWATKPVRRRRLMRLLNDLFHGKEVVRSAEVQAPSVQRLAGLHILLAEDKKLNRQLMHHILRPEGASIVDATNGLEAIDMALEQNFDVILMDVHMPELDGVEAARRIRSRLGKRTPPIYALTADVFAHAEEEDEKIFDGVILKPVDPEKLVDVLYHDVERVAGSALRESGSKRNETSLPDELVSRFRTEIVNMMTALPSDLKQGNQQAAQIIHDLKGYAGVVGKGDAVGLLEALDKACREGDSSRYRNILKELKEVSWSDG